MRGCGHAFYVGFQECCLEYNVELAWIGIFLVFNSVLGINRQMCVGLSVIARLDLLELSICVERHVGFNSSVGVHAIKMYTLDMQWWP